MGFTLKGAVGFGMLARERQRHDLQQLAVINRIATGATKDQFKDFLREMNDGD